MWLELGTKQWEKRPDRGHGLQGPVLFGLLLRGLPKLTFPVNLDARYPDARCAVRWHAKRGMIAQADSGWARGTRDGVIAGWNAFAEYRVKRDAVMVTCEVDELQAAEAFVLSVLPMALPLFGLEPMHGAAVLTASGALLVLGASRSGKSSIAASLEDRAFPLLAEDACALDDKMSLWPGLPTLSPRWDHAGQSAIATYDEKMLRLASRHTSHPQAPAAVVVLQPTPGLPSPRARPVPSAEAFPLLLEQVRHPWLLARERQALQMAVVAQLSHLPVMSLELDPATSAPERSTDVILEWLRGEDLELGSVPATASL